MRAYRRHEGIQTDILGKATGGWCDGCDGWCDAGLVLAVELHAMTRLECLYAITRLVRRWVGFCGRAACYDTRRVSVCYNTAGATLGWVLSVGLCWFALGLCYHIWTDGKMVRDFREWV